MTSIIGIAGFITGVLTYMSILFYMKHSYKPNFNYKHKKPITPSTADIKEKIQEEEYEYTKDWQRSEFCIPCNVPGIGCCPKCGELIGFRTYREVMKTQRFGDTLVRYETKL